MNYSSSTDHAGGHWHMKLSLFLKTLIQSPLRQAAIGQSILQATRPQGGLMPLLLSLGVDLHDNGFQELHIKLACMGSSLLYDEIRRFDFSVMQMIPGYDAASSECVHVMHVVDDNVDNNIKT
jgi:hypothetical protein